MRIFLFASFLLFIYKSNPQSLCPERVAKVKAATVKIKVGPDMGTGFFIDNSGTIATCLHVVIGAIQNKTKIIAQLENLDSFEVDFDKNFQYNQIRCIAYDIIILVPKKRLPKPTLGDSPEKDSIISVADFIVTPFGFFADSMNKLINSNTGVAIILETSDTSNANNYTKTLRLISEALPYISAGIGGGVSSNNLLEIVNTFLKKD